MRRSLIARFSVVLALASLAACGGPLEEHLPAAGDDLAVAAPDAEASAIIHGEMCEAAMHPTAVAILLDMLVDYGGGFGTQRTQTVICTGTVIAPDTVLTAAHCLDATGLTFGFGEILEETYFISFEPDLVYLAEAQGTGESVEFPDDAIAMSGYVAHADFVGAQGIQLGLAPNHDVGVLFLSETVDEVPSPLITPDEIAAIDVDAPVAIAGWGQQVPTSGPFEPPPPGTVGRKVCAEAFIGEVGDTEIQIGGDETTSRKCHGDSGGPTWVFLDVESGPSERLIGITSHAYSQEDCLVGGVDTRVDAYRDWIDAQMRAACEDEVRVWCDHLGILPLSYFGAAGDGDGDVGDGDGDVGDGDGDIGDGDGDVGDGDGDVGDGDGDVGDGDGDIGDGDGDGGDGDLGDGDGDGGDGDGDLGIQSDDDAEDDSDEDDLPAGCSQSGPGGGALLGTVLMLGLMRRRRR